MGYDDSHDHYDLERGVEEAKREAWEAERNAKEALTFRADELWTAVEELRQAIRELTAEVARHAAQPHGGQLEQLISTAAARSRREEEGEAPER
jgi:hypothetical protein